MIPEHEAIVQLAPASVEPISVADLAAFLRVDDTSDPVLPVLIAAARRYVESYTGLQLMPAIWRLSLDMFPMIPYLQYSPGLPTVQQPLVNYQWPIQPDAWAIRLRRPPLISVSSLIYTATDGTPTTLDPSLYSVDADSTRARVSPAAGASWPGTLFQPNAVQITFIAGHGVPFAATNGTSTVTITNGFTPSPVTPFAGSTPPTYQAVNVGGALPAPLVNGGSYRLTRTGTGTYDISDSTGAAITFTDTGSGSHYFACVSDNLRHAMRLLAGNWYENREAVVIDKPPDLLPLGVQSLLGFDRLINA